MAQKKFFRMSDSEDEMETLKEELAVLKAQIVILDSNTKRLATEIRRMQDMYLIGCYRFMKDVLSQESIEDIGNGKRPRSVQRHTHNT